MTPLYVIDFKCVLNFGEAHRNSEREHLVKGQWKLSRPQITDANE